MYRTRLDAVKSTEQKKIRYFGGTTNTTRKIFTVNNYIIQVHMQINTHVLLFYDNTSESKFQHLFEVRNS